MTVILTFTNYVVNNAKHNLVYNPIKYMKTVPQQY